MNSLLFQKLTSDVEKLQQEKGQLETMLASKESSAEKHTEQDWKLLETRLKVLFSIQKIVTTPFLLK